jgi:hypothetical protein
MDKQNVFISYAHDDDVKFGVETKGWVERFAADLNKAIRAAGNLTAEAWSDNRLRGNEYYKDTIDQKTASSSLLVPLISTLYVKKYLEEENGWLRRELEMFVRWKVSAGDLRVGNFSRICPVYLANVRKEELPEPIRPLNRKHILCTEENVPFVLEEYSTRVRLLGLELVKMLKELAVQAEQPIVVVGPSPTPKVLVYLANATSDLARERGQLKSALEKKQSTCTIVEPCGGAPAEEIRKCQITIHLLGDIDRENPGDKLAQAQIEAARSLLGMNCVVWIHPRYNLEYLISSGGEELGKFYEDFQRPNGFKVNKTPFEQFRDQVLEHIARLLRQPLPEKENEEAWFQWCQRKAYIVYDDADRKAVEKCVQEFLNRNWEAELVPHQKTKYQPNKHETNLRTCQAYLIHYGSMDENVKGVLAGEFRESQDKRKMPYYGGWIFRAADPTPEKIELQPQRRVQIVGECTQKELPADVVERVTRFRP